MRGKGYWKMNTKFLNDIKFVECMKSCIADAKNDAKNIRNNHDVWDYVKCRIRTTSISYSLKISKEIKNQEKNLIDRVTYLEETLNASPDIDTLEEFRGLGILIP